MGNIESCPLPSRVPYDTTVAALLTEAGGSLLAPAPGCLYTEWGAATVLAARRQQLARRPPRLGAGQRGWRSGRPAGRPAGLACLLARRASVASQVAAVRGSWKGAYDNKLRWDVLLQPEAFVARSTPAIPSATSEAAVMGQVLGAVAGADIPGPPVITPAMMRQPVLDEALQASAMSAREYDRLVQLEFCLQTPSYFNSRSECDAYAVRYYNQAAEASGGGAYERIPSGRTVLSADLADRAVARLNLERARRRALLKS